MLVVLSVGSSQQQKREREGEGRALRGGASPVRFKELEDTLLTRGAYRRKHSKDGGCERERCWIKQRTSPGTLSGRRVAKRGPKMVAMSCFQENLATFWKFAMGCWCFFLVVVLFVLRLRTFVRLHCAAKAVFLVWV